jgi:hypothetical protein
MTPCTLAYGIRFTTIGHTTATPTTATIASIGIVIIVVLVFAGIGGRIIVVVLWITSNTGLMPWIVGFAAVS